MKKISLEKMKHLKNVSTEYGIIAALAIDQRGSLKKMLISDEDNNTEEQLTDFKIGISENLTPYSSSILLDPEYGLPAAKKRVSNAGLIFAYEKTGYDATKEGRLPDLLDNWSVKRLKAVGCDAVKFLLYYDVDEKEEINDIKKAFVERLGAECNSEDIPFFLEIVTYDRDIKDAKSIEYAKVKPHKVIESMKEFSKTIYDVDVLKVEVPVNMNYVETYTESDFIYTKEEAEKFFALQDEATDLPYIFLSGGVSSKLFQQTLEFARKAGSNYNGVLCGRATWKDSVEIFRDDGVEEFEKWLKNQGKQNMETLNDVLKRNAVAWTSKLSLK